MRSACDHRIGEKRFVSTTQPEMVVSKVPTTLGTGTRHGREQTPERLGRLLPHIA